MRVSAADGDYFRVITLDKSAWDSFGSFSFWSVDDNREPASSTKSTEDKWYPVGSGLNASNAKSILMENLPLGTGVSSLGGNGLAQTDTEINYELKYNFRELISYISFTCYYGSNGDVRVVDGTGGGTHLYYFAEFDKPSDVILVNDWALQDSIMISSVYGTFDMNGTSLYNKVAKSSEDLGYMTGGRWSITADYNNPTYPSNRYSYFCLSSLRLFVEANRYGDIVEAIEDVGLRVDSLNETIVDSSNRIVGQILTATQKQIDNDNKLWNDTYNPSDSDVAGLGSAIFDESTQEELKEKLGLFTFVDDTMQQFLDIFATDSDGNTSLRFPGLTVDINNITYTIIEPYDFDVAETLDKFPMIIQAIRFVNGVIILLAFLAYLHHLKVRFFGED